MASRGCDDVFHVCGVFRDVLQSEDDGLGTRYARVVITVLRFVYTHLSRTFVHEVLVDQYGIWN